MTDDEIDTLAKELLTKAVTEVYGWDGVNLFHDVQEMESGELIPVYAGTSTEGYGSFLCEYMPLDAVKKIIRECARVFDDYVVVVTEKTSGQTAKRKLSEGQARERRDEVTSAMAEHATLHMVASFRARLTEVLEEIVKDATLIAESGLTAMVAQLLSKQAPGKMTADVRADIEEAAKRVAEQKRVRLRKSISGMPHILAERGPGAPTKSQAEREREGETYAAKVEEAYRKVRLETGDVPTKTKVAKELGEGGFNPRTGADSSLSAFGNKLRRLKVDYDAIARKIEGELNNNS